MTTQHLPLSYLTHSLYTFMYSDITDFRTAFNLPVAQNDPLVGDDYSLHSKLYSEEFSELTLEDSRAQKIDALVDSMYVYMGALVHRGITWDKLGEVDPLLMLPIEGILFSASMLGFNFSVAWDIVHVSNLSKLCDDSNLKATIQHYNEMGVKTYYETVTLNSGETRYAVKVKKLCKDYDGKIYPQGKVLKSVMYVEADLNHL